MNRIDEKFQQLRQQNRKALNIFLTAGYPDLQTSEELVYFLEDQGVDIIEFGIPFSDPLADGPTIQFSSQAALKQGVTLNKILERVEKIRSRSDIPLVLMSYYNPLYQLSENKLFPILRDRDIDGVIIPDLPIEEGKKFTAETKKIGINLIFLLAPTSSDDRIKQIVTLSQGFVYVVSVTGVTGARKELPMSLNIFLKSVRRASKTPLVLGFGISQPEQILFLRDNIDGIVVGSAVIDIIRTGKNKKEIFNRISNLIKNLKKVL